MSTTAEQTCKGHGLGTWLRRGEGMLKLVDPAVIEQVYGSLLREYHRFDASPAEWAREQSRRVGQSAKGITTTAPSTSRVFIEDCGLMSCIALERRHMTKEKWKPIPHWEHYSVSNLGNVRSNARCRLLKVNIDTGGYAQVKLYPAEGGRTWTVVVHRLVLAAFRRLPKPGEHGMHKNDNRSDNSLTNLKWGTKKANVKDMVRKGRVRSAGWKDRSTEETIRKIQAQPKAPLLSSPLRAG